MSCLGKNLNIFLIILSLILFRNYKYANSVFRYLTVQFVRFFWKRESNQKAKILRVCLFLE